MSRQCLKALLQASLKTYFSLKILFAFLEALCLLKERLTVNQEDFEGMPRTNRVVETRSNMKVPMAEENSTAADPAAIGIVLECLRFRLTQSVFEFRPRPE